MTAKAAAAKRADFNLGLDDKSMFRVDALALAFHSQGGLMDQAAVPMGRVSRSSRFRNLPLALRGRGSVRIQM